MPVALGFEEPATYAVRASGEVTFGEIGQLFHDIGADERLSLEHPRVLVDARQVSSAPSAAELRVIAVNLGRLVERGLGPIAVVTDSKFMYGVVRMFSMFAEPVCARVQPFREVTDARQWLDSECARAPWT